MATTLASLVVKVGADVTGVTAGLNTLDRRVRSLKRQFGSVKDSTLTWQGALSTLAGAAGLVFAANKTFQLGAAVEETASKFNTVFGPAVSQAQAFLDEYANTAGLTVTQGRELLASTGAITQALGFSQQASADFSEEIVRLSGDIASFNNTQGGAERVTRAIISALNGETEALKQAANVVVLQADVMDRAAQMTGKATSEITRQDKALATLALITERAGVAVGDLGRTMESPANRARRLVAQVLTLRDTIAHALLPAFNVVLEELGMVAGSQGFTGLGEKIQRNAQVIAAWTKFAVESFKAVALAIAAPVRIAFNLGEVIGKVLVAAAQVMTGNFEGARETLGSLVGDFGDMKVAVTDVVGQFDNMRVASGNAWTTFQEEGVPATTAVTAATNGLGKAVTETTSAYQALDPKTVAKAAKNLATATTQVCLSMDKETKAAFLAKQGLDQMTESTNRLAAAQSKLSAVTSLLSGFGISIPFAGQLQTFLSAASSFGGGRASGGPVAAGRAYVVGERGPELFVPQSSGQIAPSGGGMNAAAIVEEWLARMPAPAAYASPEVVATSRWHRQYGAMLVEILRHDGVRFST